MAPPPRDLAALLDRCAQLADDLDAGRGAPDALTTAVAALRAAFAAEVRCGGLRAAPVAARVSPGAPATALLREVLHDLRAHVAATQDLRVRRAIHRRARGTRVATAPVDAE